MRTSTETKGRRDGSQGLFDCAAWPVALCCLVAATTASAASAKDFPPTLRAASLLLPTPGVDGPFDGAPKVRGSVSFQESIYRALGLLRRELSRATAEDCRRYFHEEGVDVDRWTDPAAPPFVIEVPRTWFPRHLRRNVCAASQSGPPHLYVFIAADCARTDQSGTVASLLHELGHLARRDSTDAEPWEFFARCELLAARGKSAVGRVASAAGPYARRGDASNAVVIVEAQEEPRAAPRDGVPGQSRRRWAGHQPPGLRACEPPSGGPGGRTVSRAAPQLSAGASSPMSQHRPRSPALPATTDPWRAIPPDFCHGLPGGVQPGRFQ